MMAEGHRQRRREASLIAPSTPAKSIKAGIIKTVAPASGVLPHRFAIGEMKTSAPSSSLSLSDGEEDRGTGWRGHAIAWKTP
jgi:hypothetical protein